MAIPFTQISDTITNLTGQVDSGITVKTEINELTEQQMNRRSIIRIVTTLVILGTITTIIFVKKNKK